MKRVLQVVGSLNRGGTQAFIMNVFHNIDREKFMFDFLIFSDSKDGYYEEIKSMGVTIYSLPPRIKGILSYIKSLSDFYSKHSKEYDVVHYNVCSLTSILPLYFAKKHKVPVRIIHSHNAGWQGVHNLILHKINKLFISKIANVYLSCSDKAAKWSFSYTQALKCSKIINNGIDIKQFEYKESIRANMRNKLFLQDKFVIGNIGRFAPQKNHLFLIEIFNEVCKIENNAILLLVGNGYLENEIKRKIIDNKLEKKVIFLGIRDDVNDLMQAMDCFVFPSIYEGLGIVLIEAQTSGLQCFTSDVVPHEAKVTESIEYVSLSQKPSYWAERVIKNKNYVRKNQSDKIIEAHYSIEQTVEDLIKIYNQ